MNTKKQTQKQKGSFKKIFKYLKPYIPSVIFIVFASVVSVLLMILSALVLRQLINVINEAAVLASSTSAPMKELLDFDKVIKLCLTLIAMYGSSILLSYAQTFILAKINQSVTKKLRTEISEKINKVPLRYFDAHQHGDTLSRVTNDVDTLGEALNTTISSLVAAIFQIVGVLIAMFITSWQMALTELATIPISMILVVVFIKISQKFYVNQRKHLADVNSAVEEMYSGQQIVKAFNAEKKTGSKFRASNSALQKATYKSSILNGFMFPLMGFVSKLGYIAVCVVGGILYSNGAVDMGSLGAFMIFINMLQSPINQLGQLTGTLQSGAAAAGRVFDFLAETEEENEENKTTVLLPENVKGNIEFKNVRFGYLPEKTIINDFSLNINSGQKVAIVGPTGAGKTTIVNLLMRFYETNSGDILIDGTSIKSLKRENVRQLFSMVLQDTWLFDGSIKDNIIYANKDVSDEQLHNITKAANISHYIESLPDGYDYILDNESTISGGQKQLLTIARAMLEDSPILILDEATSNVDTRTELQIQEAMDNLSKGKTSFVIAHRLSTIKNADVILVLKDGDIIEQGNHHELLKANGFYKELYETQFSAS